MERGASHSSPASPRHSPQHLEPNPALRRKPAYESAAQRARAVAAMHVIGSFSSSEDELEYASCEEHEREWLALALTLAHSRVHGETGSVKGCGSEGPGGSELLALIGSGC